MTDKTIWASASRVRGLWHVEATAPYTVSDPAKARRLLGLPAVPRSQRSLVRLERAVLPVSLVRRFRRQASVQKRREFERLLSGGARRWQDDFENLVVNQGLDDLLDITLSGGTQDTTWFVGLTDGTPTPAAGDTLASHAGWVEVTDYDETNRVAWVDGGVSGASVSNSASPAVFTISANGTTVGGGFLAGVNTGTAGRLYAVGAFSAGDKLLDDNDTLDVTGTFTTADDGA
jgi:hypothetical protein